MVCTSLFTSGIGDPIWWSGPAKIYSRCRTAFGSDPQHTNPVESTQHEDCIAVTGSPMISPKARHGVACAPLAFSAALLALLAVPAPAASQSASQVPLVTGLTIVS